MGNKPAVLGGLNLLNRDDEGKGLLSSFLPRDIAPFRGV